MNGSGGACRSSTRLPRQPSRSAAASGGTPGRARRSTAWMRFESLEQALDPEDGSRTVEGLPAPVRAIVIAGR